MSTVPNERPAPVDGRTRQILPAGTDAVALGLVLVGLLALYLPSYATLAQKVWPTDEQGHGPIILGVGLWLIWSKRFELARLPAMPDVAAGSAVFLFGIALCVLGRSQYILFFEILSQIIVVTGLILLFKGRAGLRLLWFPLVFLLFMVPLPASVVASVTGPLKSAVSAVAGELLHAVGYPVGRSGVILTVGPYQLLVADACAGLNSMFTLEALGMLYMNLMRYTNAVRNVLLAILIIPIAFIANIIRVMILVLVTYHFGDEAGQGFVHGFAGMVLFLAGLMLMLVADKGLRLFFPAESAK